MDDYNMTMVQGDTFSFGIEVAGFTDPVTGAEFVGKLELDGEQAWEKTLGDGVEYAGAEDDSSFYDITLDPEDTEDLTPGQYYYQLRLIFGEDVFTVMKGILKIEGRI